MKKKANQGGRAPPLPCLAVSLTRKTARGGRGGGGLSLTLLLSNLETLLSLRTLKGDTVSAISISLLIHLAPEQD